MSMEGKGAKLGVSSLDASQRNDSPLEQAVKDLNETTIDFNHLHDAAEQARDLLTRALEWNRFDAKPCGDQGPFNEGCQREAGHEGDHTHWHPTSGGSGSWAQRREAASTDVDDAKHLLRAARAILGCEDPDTSLVPDAECLRQLAINFRGALSRLVEAAESGAGVALRVKEARGVLAGEQYDPAEDVSVSSNEAKKGPADVADDRNRGGVPGGGDGDRSGVGAAPIGPVEAHVSRSKASTRKGCAGDPEWDALIRIAKAASAVHRYVTKNGGFKGGVLENHGHNRTGTGCLECQILNEVQESLRAWGDLPETPQGGDEMRAPGESPDLVGRASGMAGSSSSDEHHEGGVDRAEGPVGERLPSGTLSTQGATPPGQVRRPDVPPEVTRDCDGADLKVGDIVQHLEGDEDYRIDSFDPPVPRTRFARVTWLHPTKGEVPQRGPVPLTNIRKRRERASTGKDGGK